MSRRYQRVDVSGTEVLKELPKVILQTALFGSVPILFGYLYISYSTDSASNNNCQNNQFKNWAFSNGVYLFLFLIPLFLNLLQQEAFTYYTGFQNFCEQLFRIGFLPLPVFVIGLLIVSDPLCGSLYTMNYYFYGAICLIAIVCGVLFLILASGMKKAYR